jgi:predicted DNA-binding transcriptional regulator YafY
MRASRLVSLLLLLQHRGRLTAAELAEALEVSVRTIYRDVEALGAAGVPVYTESGRNGGCQLIDGYRTRLTGLTTKEAEALFATGMPGPVGELGLGTVLGAAQLKLLAALPKELADRAVSARQRFHFDAPTWFRAARNEPHLATVAAAVWDDRRIVVRYRHPGSDDAAPRALEPYGLVCKAGVWYLVARRDGELRTYRVSRVQEVATLDEHFERPADFDLATHWRDAVAGFEASLPPVDVVVRASEHGIDELSWLTRSSGRAIKERHLLDDGWTHATIASESVDDAYTELLRLGADVEIIEPVELRARTIETADAMATLYTQPSKRDHPSAGDSSR